MKSLLTLNKYLWRYRFRLFLGVLFIFGSNFMELFKIIYIGKAINKLQMVVTTATEEGLQGVAFRSFLFYGLCIIGLAFSSGLFRFAMRQTIIVASRLIEFDIKNNVYQHYQKLSMSFYKKNKIGDLMNRISEDVSQVRMYLGPGIMYTINLFSLFAIFITYMIWRNPTLALYTLAPLPILSFLIYRVSSLMNRKSTEVQQAQSALSAFVQDTFSGIRIIKSYNREEVISKDYLNKTQNYRKKALSLALVNAFFFPLMILLIGLSYIFILYSGGMQYIHGEINEIAVLAEFFMFVGALAWPFTALGWVTSVIQRAEASQARINEFLHEKPEIVNTGKKGKNIEGAIRFENVSFIYPNTGVQALKSINFEIKAGETLAILGKTGSGKSTVAQLIPRLFDPSSGNIYLDGTNLKEYNLYELRRNIGYVPQESFLFSDSIQNNIGFGLDQANKRQIVAAADKAALTQNIDGFKEGYETIVGERGITLSGGQKQRVSIARAIIGDPKILIFDDSLSAVDTATEDEILKKLREETQSKTTIIISHRVSSAIRADHIIYLKDGEIAEQGTHNQLMQQKGLYNELYQMQLTEKEFES